ncbi:MAG: hypothetical protein ACRDJW_14755 [Thermomicrobiales bacterium]
MRYIEQLFDELEERLLNEPRMKEAIRELQDLILARYPQATFEMGIGDDPLGIHITATVDVEDAFEVVDLYIDRMSDFQIDEGLPIYIVPARPFPRPPETVPQRAKTALPA